MKFYFLFVLFLIFISLSLVSASLNLVPGKLYFDMNKNKEVCRAVTLISGDYKDKIKVRDIWAGVNESYNTNKFYMKAEDFGLKISYKKTIENFNGTETIKICLSGENAKEGKGALIFTPESESNVVVEVGTWIFVDGIKFNPPIFDEIKKETQNQETQQQNREENNRNSLVTIKENNNIITGAFVGLVNKTSFIIIVLLVIIISAIILIIYFRRKNHTYI